MNYNPDLISTSLKMLAVLAILLGGLLILLYFTKRKFASQGGGLKGKLIRVLGNTYIGVKKQICLVEIPGAVLVLGLSSDNISLLAKIDDKESLESLRAFEGVKKVSSFADQLYKLSFRFKEHKSKGALNS
ncbi:MAG: flagellar biosynthetic protein FliO [Desulfobacteraceae bacterium]|nr:MAG: flagellar biosynthetic protein FliO [Desulfobacteraceae bacterium]